MPARNSGRFCILIFHFTLRKMRLWIVSNYCCVGSPNSTPQNIKTQISQNKLEIILGVGFGDPTPQRAT
jgi:hypothetical protein